MKNNTVREVMEKSIDEIDSIKASYKRFKAVEKEREYLSKYFLIYVSGILEVSYKTLISSYCLKHCTPSLHNYFDTVIRKKSKNATIENICELLKNIDPAINKKFKYTLKRRDNYNQIKSSTESLSTLRHEVAHGNLDTIIYFSDVENYYVYAKEILEVLDEILENVPN